MFRFHDPVKYAKVRSRSIYLMLRIFLFSIILALIIAALWVFRFHDHVKYAKVRDRSICLMLWIFLFSIMALIIAVLVYSGVEVVMPC